MQRDIIQIDEEKCNGCGICISACSEGALALVDGKARLVSAFFCDGLGACIPQCPTGAITIIRRDVEDELKQPAVKTAAESAAKPAVKTTASAAQAPAAAQSKIQAKETAAPVKAPTDAETKVDLSAKPVASIKDVIEEKAESMSVVAEKQAEATVNVVIEEKAVPKADVSAGQPETRAKVEIDAKAEPRAVVADKQPEVAVKTETEKVDVGGKVETLPEKQEDVSEQVAKEAKDASGDAEPRAGGCPGTRTRTFVRPADPSTRDVSPAAASEPVSELRQWPVQIKLMPVKAPYLENARLLVAADCAAYTRASFHQDFMKNRITIIGCPKLDAVDYADKLTEILRQNNIRSVLVVRMEVPCCGGLEMAVKRALQASGKMVPWQIVTLGTDGTILED